MPLYCACLVLTCITGPSKFCGTLEAELALQWSIQWLHHDVTFLIFFPIFLPNSSFVILLAPSSLNMIEWQQIVVVASYFSVVSG